MAYSKVWSVKIKLFTDQKMNDFSPKDETIRLIVKFVSTQVSISD